MKFIAMYSEKDRPIIYIKAEDNNKEEKYILLNGIESFQLDTPSALNSLNQITDKTVIYYLLECHNIRLFDLIKSTSNKCILENAEKCILQYELDFGDTVIKFPHDNIPSFFNKPVG